MTDWGGGWLAVYREWKKDLRQEEHVQCLVCNPEISPDHRREGHSSVGELEGKIAESKWSNVQTTTKRGEVEGQ